MILRKSRLPPGWYPRDPEAIAAFLARRDDPGAGSESPGPVLAAAAPHAGWYYSGAIAARACRCLASRPGAVVAVVGGHLPPGIPPLFALEDAVETPLGPLEIDAPLRDALFDALGGAPDRSGDNTVEVLLPMVKYFFPQAKLLWLRLPAEEASFKAGKALARTAASLGREILVLGSTDLTHYGVTYGFTPRGNGEKALDWVRNVNDRRFIAAVEAGDPAAVLARAEGERSACSAGAILGVMGYAAERREGAAGAGGELIAYGTSADAARGEGEKPPDSFVGYGAFRWTR